MALQQVEASAEASPEGTTNEASASVESLPSEVAQEVAVGLIAALRELPDCDSVTVSAAEDGSMLLVCKSGESSAPYSISAEDVAAAQMLLDAEDMAEEPSDNAQEME